MGREAGRRTIDPCEVAPCYVARVPSQTESPDCLSCGACCFSNLSDYVRVSGEDYARLGDAAEALTQFDGNRCYMRMEDGHCAALQLDRTSGRFVCAVYERRPETCRTLERGSGACAAERWQKADRARGALANHRSG